MSRARGTVLHSWCSFASFERYIRAVGPALLEKLFWHVDYTHLLSPEGSRKTEFLHTMTGSSNSDGDSAKYFDRARVIMISVIRSSNYTAMEEEGTIAGGSLVLKARCSEVLIFLNSFAFRRHIPLSIQSLDSDKSMRKAVIRVLNRDSNHYPEI